MTVAAGGGERIPAERSHWGREAERVLLWESVSHLLVRKCLRELKVLREMPFLPNRALSPLSSKWLSTLV